MYLDLRLHLQETRELTFGASISYRVEPIDPHNIGQGLPPKKSTQPLTYVLDFNYLTQMIRQGIRFMLISHRSLPSTTTGPLDLRWH